jgi:hypothetical protein
MSRPRNPGNDAKTLILRPRRAKSTRNGYAPRIRHRRALCRDNHRQRWCAGSDVAGSLPQPRVRARPSTSMGIAHSGRAIGADARRKGLEGNRAAKTPLERPPRRPWPRKTRAPAFRGWLIKQRRRRQLKRAADLDTRDRAIGGLARRSPCRTVHLEHCYKF